MHSRNSEEKISAMRINARNLRAKVRSMLPLDVCCKYLDRNTRIDKLQCKKLQWQRREQLRTLESNIPQHWSNACDTPSCEFFSEKFQNVEPRHMFSKLTRQEIEQICDHKHYFVGEAHIADFDEFLQPTSQPTQKKVLPNIEEPRTERSTKLLDKPPSETFQTIRQKGSCTNEQRWYSTQSRIKDLRQEESQNRETQRRMLHLRQRRADNNISRQQENLQAKLELQRVRRQKLEQQMKDKTRCDKEDAQIEVLTNQLKSIVCFHRRKHS